MRYLAHPNTEFAPEGLMTTRTVINQMLTVHSLPPRALLFAGIGSAVSLAITAVASWPPWAVILAGLLPWIPVFASEMAWMRRHYDWLVLFYLLVFGQGGHVLEHVAQMIQIHVLGIPAPHAHGIFGALDIEWVHFVWNTGVLAAVLLLVARYRRNPWLWLALALAAWHETEHLYIFSLYLRTGLPGNPGLLARGGVLGGGLPLSRPDLHFLYNLVETTPMFIGFVYQCRQAWQADSR
jgi:hypothetical protein